MEEGQFQDLLHQVKRIADQLQALNEKVILDEEFRIVEDDLPE